MRWFRLYDDLLDDPKVQQLPAPLFKHWVNIMCLASKGTPRGTLPDVEDIAFRLRLTPSKAFDVIGELMAAGLIERGEEGRLAPHNWAGRQRVSDDVAERVRKSRNVSRNSSVTLHETPLKLSRATDTETDTETEKTPSGEGETSRAPARMAFPIPENLAMTVDDAEQAKARGLSETEADAEWGNFTSYYAARENERRTDWHAQWRTWLGKMPQFPAKSSTNGVAPRREKPVPSSSGVVSRADGAKQRQIIGRD